MTTPINNNGIAPVAPRNDAHLLNKSPEFYSISVPLSIFHEPGEVVELRALQTGAGPLSSLHTTLADLQARALALNADGYNCYHTINPIQPGFTGGSAKDINIAWIRWIPYDIDPDRKDSDGNKLKGDAAATDAEKACSAACAERIIEFWRGYGVEPALVDHGNGYCVMVPADLDPIDSRLVAELLKFHAQEFAILGAHIDVSVANPSRILRVPSTVNRKGVETPERPHRMASMISPGNRDQVLTADDIRDILPAPEAKPISGIIIKRSKITPEWAEEFFAHSEILHHKREAYSNGSYKWVLKSDVEDYCPNHEAHNSANGPSTQVAFIDKDGILGFQCSHSACTEIHWRQFRDYHEKRNVEAGRGRFREEHPDLDGTELVIAHEALNDTVLKAEALLAGKHELRYFRRGSDLVKPVQHNKKDVTGLGRDKESVVVQPVTNYTIVRDVSLHAKCVKANGKPTSFNANLAEHLLDRVRCEPTDYRVLDMVTTSPVLLPDGTILDRPGHKCGVLFVGGGADYGIVPDQPTKDDAKKALQKFDAIYHGFPFVKNDGEDWRQTSGYATTLAAILSIVARPALPTIPMITANATSRGTGKTKLIEAAVQAAVGCKPTVVSFHNEDEFSKTLVPLLREGDRTTLIDNVSIPLSGDMLCSVLTSEEHRARILGQSEQVRLLNRSVFFATGNNLAIQGDLTRRALQVRLDADCEHPERRRFDFDPVIRAGKMHPELCIAALKALRAYLLAGKPDVLSRPALGSFEEWDRLVCGCLIWCGYADPVMTQSAVEESDPELEANLELLSVWHDSFREPVSVGTIGSSTLNPVKELLAGGEGWNAKAIGKRLRTLQDRVIGGYKLQGKINKGVRLWKVTKNGKINPEAPFPLVLAARALPATDQVGW
jgi:hypothetical protein